MHKGNWDDLRFVLAVAEGGSVSAAARTLGVNHATVLRRVSAFEEAQGVPIFDRTALGYVVLPDRLRVIEAAREAALAIDTVSRMMRGAEAQFTGTVRITSTDTFCHTVLPGIVAELTARSKDLSIEILSANNHVDLGRLGADITIRPAMILPDDLRGETAGELGFAVYAARDGHATTWLALRGALTRATVSQWLETNVAGRDIVGGSDSFIVLRELAAAGMGRAIMPCCLGDSDPRLQRLPDAMPLTSVPIWVASHAELEAAPRLRAIRAKLTSALQVRSAALSGRPQGEDRRT
ncbi:MAG: LysR family transcriptional regulator [Rhodobacterales bacterium]|nr:LysR family transcriptional regulator [Rhodobacterales bacterium]